MEAEGHDTGFDAANECMVNLIEKGIIDPTKVTQHWKSENLEYFFLGHTVVF
jgi:chaperonin GroEL (HSP60 family)